MQLENKSITYGIKRADFEILNLINKQNKKNNNMLVGNLSALYLLDNQILKLGLFDAEEETLIDIPAEIQALAEQRRLAKQDKNWSQADRLRVEIEEKGWEMKDGKDDYELVIK